MATKKTKMPPKVKEKSLLQTTINLLNTYLSQSKHHQLLLLFTHFLSSSPPLSPFLLLPALSSAHHLNLPRLLSSLHSLSLKSNLLHSPHLLSLLISLYPLPLSRKLFDDSPLRTAATWNSLISLYLRNGQLTTPLQLFRSIDVPKSPSCFNSLISAFAKRAGSSFKAQQLQPIFPTGDCSSYSSVAFSLFREMVFVDGVKPDLITVLGILPAVSGIGELTVVKEIHGFAVRNYMHRNLLFGSAVIEGYGRCGGLGSARRVFDGMSERDVVVWSSMVSGYAFHGEAESAFSIFERMGRSGVRPDSVMFLGLLKACSHSGLADDALRYFEVMSEVFGVRAGEDHYSCLVDVLSRAGRLDEAYGVIRGMPMKVTAKAWGAFLCACRSYGEVRLAEIAGRALFEIEPGNARNYVLLASTYAGAGMFQEAENVRKEMEERKIMLSSGGSWVIS